MAIGAVIAGALVPVGLDYLKKDLIPWLILQADKIFGGSPPTAPGTVGPKIKFPLVQGAVAAFDAAMASLNSTAPASPASIQGAVQDVVNELEAKGLLVGHATILPTLAAPGATQATGGSTTLRDIINFATWLETSPIPILPKGSA